MVIKLLPKPKGKIPRKPILGTEIEQKNKFNYNVFKTNKHHNIQKELIYNDYSKKLIRQNPGIIKAINFLSKKPFENRFIDPKGRFEMFRVTDFIVNIKPRRGGLTKESYFIKINDGQKEHTFYLKKQYADSITELVLLNSIEKYTKEYGLNIIKPHFAFSTNEIKDYILYDFTHKLTVVDALKLNKISKSESNIISEKLRNFEQDMRKKYKIPIHDVENRNCFIDISKKPYKLYLFDLGQDPYDDAVVKKQYNILKNKFINKN